MREGQEGQEEGQRHGEGRRGRVRRRQAAWALQCRRQAGRRLQSRRRQPGRSWTTKSGLRWRRWGWGWACRALRRVRCTLCCRPAAGCPPQATRRGGSVVHYGECRLPAPACHRRRCVRHCDHNSSTWAAGAPIRGQQWGMPAAVLMVYGVHTGLSWLPLDTLAAVSCTTLRAAVSAPYWWRSKGAFSGRMVCLPLFPLGAGSLHWGRRLAASVGAR